LAAWSCCGLRRAELAPNLTRRIEQVLEEVRRRPESAFAHLVAMRDAVRVAVPGLIGYRVTPAVI
jgi:hypothetical protein